MDSEILSKTNRLFWLGRYVERTMIEIEVMMDAYDRAIDQNDVSVVDTLTFRNRIDMRRRKRQRDKAMQSGQNDLHDARHLLRAIL